VLAQEGSGVGARRYGPNLYLGMREQQSEQLSARIASGASYRSPHSHPHEYASLNNFMHFSVSRFGARPPHHPDASVYPMRMARVNITIPDELLGRARGADLNVSRIASTALAEELDRLAKIAELDAYLATLDEELGPPSEKDTAAARRWVDELIGAEPTSPQGRQGAA